MSLSHEYVGPKILGKIKIYVLTRAELLFPLCYEIPCTLNNVNIPSFLQILLVMGTFGNPKRLSRNSEYQRFEHYDFNYSRRYHFNFTIVKFGQILERPACHLCYTKIGKFCQYSSCFQE